MHIQGAGVINGKPEDLCQGDELRRSQEGAKEEGPSPVGLVPREQGAGGLSPGCAAGLSRAVRADRGKEVCCEGQRGGQ